ncbi:MAG: phosphatidylserine/phosphatidylglycerophosphate/cardiolipin synthase family protein [Saccharospirillaceae bacterium]|nr:phosphatidylserine/phosphatidylglycerophosphate/cardiolipin synthase family protein [Pseudomonadales bacterium]NRB79587.1 phosphatidylserine/phosphatidylglycerophosphate/cardiolipin synthase family protein [Saccharospirillaceae bacterium]
MIFWLLTLCLSVFTSFILLKKPYLRETSIGWLLAIWAVPYIGSIVFLTMVIRRKDKTRQHSAHIKEHYAHNDYLTKPQNIIERVGVNNGFLAYANLEESVILRDDEFLTQLIEQVEQAEKSIWICTYILSGDAKEVLLTRLYEAYERGVEIYLLVDRIGSGFLFGSKSRKEYLNFPFKTAIFRQSLLQSLLYVEKRLHSKIAIIDRQTALIGSHNIRDEIKHDAKGFARNLSLLFTGSVVAQLELVFADLYQCATNETILIDNKKSKNSIEQIHCASRIIYSDPLALNYQYCDYLNCLFYSAQQRLYIWMPYMIPSDILRTSIINAHKTGVDVKVLIPIKSDSMLVDNAHQLVLNELTDHGVPCAASTGAFDHSKIFIVDNLTMLGSTNLDHRSLYRNYEANIEINTKGFADTMSRIFLQEFNSAIKIECTHPTTKRMVINQITSLIASLY